MSSIYIVNAKVADDLTTHGTRASAVIVLTQYYTLTLTNDNIIVK